jgi:hypothetical protein
MLTMRQANQTNRTWDYRVLRTEIIEHSAPYETTVCNLASLALPTFISDGKYDFKKLHDSLT